MLLGGQKTNNSSYGESSSSDEERKSDSDDDETESRIHIFNALHRGTREQIISQKKFKKAMIPDGNAMKFSNQAIITLNIETRQVIRYD